MDAPKTEKDDRGNVYVPETLDAVPADAFFASFLKDRPAFADAVRRTEARLSQWRAEGTGAPPANAKGMIAEE